MTSSSIVALLQATVTLLTMLQTANIAPPLRAEAQQVADQAISIATAYVDSLQPTLLTQPTVSVVDNYSSSLSFTASPTSGTAPLGVTFNAYGLDVGGVPSSDTITFGDGSTSLCYGAGCQVSHTYQSSGTYSATLTNGSGTTLATVTVTVTGNQTQSMSFTASPTSGTAPLSVTFTPSSSSGYYAVNFGDGSSASLQQGTISHTYAQAGTYTATFESDALCLHTSPMCEVAQQSYGSVTVTVTNSQTQTISFTASPTSGTVPLSVTFNGSGLNIGSYTVNFGDGQSGSIFVPACDPSPSNNCSSLSGSVSHTYQSAGTYAAMLISSSGTTLGTATVSVTGNQTQNNSFTASPTSGTAPLSVTFTPSSSSGYYAVNFGDGSSASLQQGTISHTYVQAGTYTATFESDALCLHTSPMCEVAQQSYGSVTVTVTNGQAQTINFTASPTSGTAPLSVTFNASPAGTYNINFGDGTSGTLNPAPTCSSCQSVSTGGHTYQSAGTYTATLNGSTPSCLASAQSSCPQVQLGTVTITVTSGQTQSLSFTASPTSGTIPLGVSFSASQSAAGDTVNFGDGTTGTLNLVVSTCGSGGGNCGPSAGTTHTYTQAGTYNATLNAQYGPILASQTITATAPVCQVQSIYAVQVPGYVYSNLYMTVQGLPSSLSGSDIVGITGADTWDNLIFNLQGSSGGVDTLVANQTVNSQGVSYIEQLQNSIEPNLIDGQPISCQPI